MKSRITHSIVLTAIILSSGGCKDNPQLVRKSKEQVVEIESLKSELAGLEEKLKDAPGDQSKVLEAEKKEEITQVSKLKELDQEVARLTAERDKAKAELEKFLKNRGSQRP
jgi:seryl-tRNA synthetase